MIEWFKHLLGICGEPHPSLLNLIWGFPVLGYLLFKLKEVIKRK